MTLKDVPPQLWYIAAAGVVALLVVRQLGKTAAAAGKAVNPLNPDNVFSTGVNDLGKQISGNTNWNLGGWFYEVTH